MKLEIRIPSRESLIAKKKPMVDLASLRLNNIWMPQPNRVSAPHVAIIRHLTRKYFFFLQTTVTGCLFHKEEGAYKVDVVFT